MPSPTAATVAAPLPPWMSRARLVLTFIGAILFFGPFLRDANASHLLNPTWPGHARLHFMWAIAFMVGFRRRQPLLPLASPPGPRRPPPLRALAGHLPPRRLLDRGRPRRPLRRHHPRPRAPHRDPRRQREHPRLRHPRRPPRRRQRPPRPPTRRGVHPLTARPAGCNALPLGALGITSHSGKPVKGATFAWTGAHACPGKRSCSGYLAMT